MENKNQDLPKSPFPHWLSFTLVNPWRSLVVSRERFIRKAGVKLGDSVLELGAGPGFFTEYIAKVVTETGIVYAHDVQEKMIERLKKRMAGFELNENITPILSSSKSIPLPSHSVDVVFAANVFEEIEEEGLLEATAQEMGRLLKKKGRITVVEHRYGVSKKRFSGILGALESAGFKTAGSERTIFMHFAMLEKTRA